jgi:hypothetical protein
MISILLQATCYARRHGFVNPRIRDRYNHTLAAALFGGKMAAIQAASQTESANSLGVLAISDRMPKKS